MKVAALGFWFGDASEAPSGDDVSLADLTGSSAGIDDGLFKLTNYLGPDKTVDTTADASTALSPPGCTCPVPVA